MKLLIFIFVIMTACSGKSVASDNSVIVRTVEHLGDRYTVVSVRLNADTDIRLYGGRNGGITFADSIGQAGKEGRRVIALMNGGMYTSEHSPVGLFISGSEGRSPLKLGDGSGNFFLHPNGVFWMNRFGELVITTTPEFQAKGREVRLATQSGPSLLINGDIHPAFRLGSPNKLTRNAVGVPLGGKSVYLVMSQGAVRFHDIATLFRDVLGCDDALFLDATVSNLWTEGEVSESRYGAVIAVTSKK